MNGMKKRMIHCVFMKLRKRECIIERNEGGIICWNGDDECRQGN